MSRRKGVEIASGMIAIALAWVPAGAAQTARLQLEPLTNNRVRITATGLGTNSAVVEQTAILGDSNSWHMTPVALGSSFRPNAGNQYFRLRVVPSPANTPGPGATLGFVSVPTTVRAGETTQFELESFSPLRELTWLVNGLPGGAADVGVISTQGLYTAPACPTNRIVEIMVRAVVDGGVAEANAFLTVQGAAPQTGSRTILSAEGGTLFSAEGDVRLTVPPGALPADQVMGIENILQSAAGYDTEEFDTLALFLAGPDIPAFLKPVQVEFPLNRWVEPGSQLSLYVFTNTTPGGWNEDGTATVLPGGLRAVASLNHFSLWSVRRRVPIQAPSTPMPSVTSIEPATLREGELRPLLILGSNLDRVNRITVHELNGAPALTLHVHGFMSTATAPGELGVMLKSLPDSSLPANTSRAYRLRLNMGLRFTEVNVTVQGLNEFQLLPGQTFTVPTALENHQTFSRIQLLLGSTLNSEARVLAWQATDTVEIYGSVLARGIHGPRALGPNPGRLPIPVRDFFGAGDGAPIPSRGVPPGFVSQGRPTLTVDLNQILRGAAGAIYGQPGRSGVGSDEEAFGEAMYTLFESEVSDFVSSHVPLDPGYFDHRREITQALTEDHAEGLLGQQGRPGGWVGLPPRIGDHASVRVTEPGGGGGGGGASEEYQLAGGSGGGGGGAISLIAGSTLTFGTWVGDGSLSFLVDTSGGNGGHGGAAVGMEGGGGGGGPGGAGTIHLLAGEQLIHPHPELTRLRHQAGDWGHGGFLMTVNTHRQANPFSWLEPQPEPQARSQAELAGPDYSSTGSGIFTSIRRERLVEASVLSFPRVDGVLQVVNRNGSTPVRMTGQGRPRRVRFILAPGHNQILVSSSQDRAVLNRAILVLNAPDSDSDGITDAEEVQLGLNANSADSDGDGISDSDEWLAGGQSAPGDRDGDGWPDAAEIAAGSDPDDSTSTPVNAPGSSAGIIAGPQGIVAVRPAYGAAQGISPSIVVATPTPAGVVRPEWTGASGLVHGGHIARPQAIRVQRQ